MLDRFQHILVPLNFSEQNELALDVVHDFAKITDITLSLLHVIEPINSSDDLEVTEFLNQLGESAAASLQEMKSRFADVTAEVSCENRIGKRTEEIVKFADENNVDLIVLSSHRVEQRGPASQVASLSYQIGILANCSVLLVK